MAEARKWKKAVVAEVSEQKPSRPLLKAKLKLTRHSSSEPDFDGLVSSFKHCIDGLIEAGVILNDKMSNIGQPTYQWTYAPQKEGFIEIYLEEV